MEAELLVFMVAMVSEGLCGGTPGPCIYADYSWVPPLFLRATRHADFVKLGRAVGIDDAETLQQAVRDGCQEKLSEYGTSFGFRPRGNLLGMMNIAEARHVTLGVARLAAGVAALSQATSLGVIG